MTALNVIYRAPSDLKPAARNPRTHSAKQIGMIAQAIQSFGFNNPILLDGNDQIIAGHGRVLAALKLGLALVPTIPLSHLSAAAVRAYIVADNRLAELAGWDTEMLAIELGELVAQDLDFSITDIGFETAEIDIMLAAPADAEPDPADTVQEPADVATFVRPGDLWLLGEHRLFCGDALDPATYQALLGPERAQMMFADPPYNVKIDGHVSGLGKAAHREFAMASGEMSDSDFTQFLSEATNIAAEHSEAGSIHFLCMDWRHLGHLLSAASGSYSEFKNLCVWVKSNGGMGSLYRSQHELVAVFKVGSGKHINNVELGRHGRSRTNVWQYPGMNSFQAGRDDALQMHPTVKPIALVADAIYDCSERGGLILDPFAGSGTTILAAERTGRRARAIELDPRYVEVSLRRFATETGIIPMNAATGVLMPSVAALGERLTENTLPARSRKHAGGGRG